MKIEQAKQKIQHRERMIQAQMLKAKDKAIADKEKPDVKLLPPAPRRVLDGEIVGPVTMDITELGLTTSADQMHGPAVQQATVVEEVPDGEVTEYISDLDMALGLLKQSMDLMEYLHDSKLNATIEPIDRKQMRVLVGEIREFMNDASNTYDDLNVSSCKFYCLSSCIKNKLGDNVTCSSCKRYKLKKAMVEKGLVDPDEEFTERDMQILENVEKALQSRGQTL